VDKFVDYLCAAALIAVMKAEKTVAIKN